MSKSLLMIGNYLSAARHTRSVGEELGLRLQQRGWQVLSASGQTNRLLRLADMLATAIFHARQYRVALVEVYSGPAFTWAEAVCAALRLLKKPFVLALHGGGLPEFAQSNPRRVARLLGSAAAVVTPSRWIAVSLATLHSNIQYIPNAIQVDQYPYTLRGNITPRLSWLRAFHIIYQPWLAVEALSNLRKIFPSANLLMIGPDKGDSALEKTNSALCALELQDAVVIGGGVDKSEVPTWLNRADIFLNTTTYESFGVSLLEAAACGLPIVTTNVGELPYLWADGSEALLVPPNDPVAMANAIHRILSEPGLAEKLSFNGRKKAEQFDWSIVLPQWEKLFNGLV